MVPDGANQRPDGEDVGLTRLATGRKLEHAVCNGFSDLEVLSAVERIGTAWLHPMAPRRGIPAYPDPLPLKGVRRCHERERWDDDLAAQLQSPRCEPQGGCAIANHDPMPNVEAGLDLLFKLLDKGAVVREPVAIEDPVYSGK